MDERDELDQTDEVDEMERFERMRLRGAMRLNDKADFFSIGCTLANKVGCADEIRCLKCGARLHTAQRAEANYKGMDKRDAPSNHLLKEARLTPVVVLSYAPLHHPPSTIHHPLFMHGYYPP